MDTICIDSKAVNSVRWPLRILAGIVYLAALIGAVGLLDIVWSRGATSPEAIRSLLFLPAGLLFLRFAWHAAVHGRSVELDWWPFASGRVALGYLILLSICGVHP